MKTELAKPACRPARYTGEYKQQALELWRASGRSAAKVAAELGIRPPLLYRWAQRSRGERARVSRGLLAGSDLRKRKRRPDWLASLVM